MRRVAITGMGIVSCLGNDCDDVLHALRKGRSGIGLRPELEELGLKTTLTGLIREFGTPPRYPFEAQNIDPTERMVLRALQEALDTAGLKASQLDAEHTSIVIGGTEDSPLVAAGLAARLDTHGPTITLTTGSASAATAIGQAFHYVRSGAQARAICGGVQADSARGCLELQAQGMLSVSQSEPQRASRPFDMARDGLVASAGVGLLVIEDLVEARQRGAEIYAEILGYGCANDIEGSADGTIECLQLSLENADLKPGEIDYINASAAGVASDALEASAIARVFGKTPFVSSTKSMTGHERAASGSNELIYTVIMLRHDFIAASLNVDEPDPECEGINLVTEEGIYAQFYTALSTSLEPGGINSCIVVGKPRP